MILYPTETIYALGVNALDEAEIAELFRLKGRDEGKSVSWLVRGIADIERYAQADDVVLKVAEEFLPGPLTLILKARNKVPRHAVSHDGTVGFRISSDPIAQKVIADFMSLYDAPLTCTSANISGLPTLPTPAEITQQFQRHHHHAAAIDWQIHDDGPRFGTASTIVRIVDQEIEILREGSITPYDIMNSAESCKK